MRFTAIEWEILDHRLGAADAIAEVLEQDHGYHPDTVRSRVNEIQAGGKVWSRTSALTG